MPGISGVELLKHIRSEYPDTVVALLTAFGTVETAVEARKLGVYDYITKPVNPNSLRIVVARALEHLSLREEVQTLRRALDQRPGFQNIVGGSDALAYALDMAARASQSDVTVLVHGETGTGKELLARGIHCSSPRKSKPFVTISCGAIPKDLLESELFGQVKGAFTGSATHKMGKFESAEGGTVLLDEIGELPLELQVKVLRLIQEHEIENAGDTVRIPLNVRIIAATHRNLLGMVAVGGFKENLYYRLNVVPIELQPLRERGEDIPELVEHFFKIARGKQGRPNLKLSIALLPHFSAYRWPGNIRELENVIERLVMLATGDEITFEDLPAVLRRHRPALGTLHVELPAYGISLEAVEKELIAQALSRFHGNQTQASRYLDLSRKALIYRIEKYGLRGEPDAGENP
jgi:two-component system NtrC family response regulator